MRISNTRLVIYYANVILYQSRISVGANEFGETELVQTQPSGHETPLHFATEDTPAQFSRNDSLSDLSSAAEEEHENTAVGFTKSKSNKGMDINFKCLQFKRLY